MPYLIGTNAIRRTIPYLEKGKLIFRKNVKVMTINYCDKGENVEYHQGAKDFVHWNVPQVQYKNPDVQVLFYANLFPTPFVRCWLDTGEDVVMDVFNKTSAEIMDQLVKVLGQAEPRKEAVDLKIKSELPKFGSGFARHCVCEIPGQVPCPQVVKIPKHMTGKYKFENNLLPPKGTIRD